jgi:hypothetical protein
MVQKIRREPRPRGSQRRGAGRRCRARIRAPRHQQQETAGPAMPLNRLPIPIRSPRITRHKLCVRQMYAFIIQLGGQAIKRMRRLPTYFLGRLPVGNCLTPVGRRFTYVPNAYM